MTRASRLAPICPAVGPCEIVLVDARRARRFHVLRTSRGSLHLDESERLDEHWDEKEHHRPSMLSAHGRSYASVSHEREERRQRFGREVCAWLERGAPFAAPMPVLCSAAMLGVLRRIAPASLLERLSLHVGAIGGLRRGELAGHPALAGLLPAAG